MVLYKLGELVENEMTSLDELGKREVWQNLVMRNIKLGYIKSSFVPTDLEK